MGMPSNDTLPTSDEPVEPSTVTDLQASTPTIPYFVAATALLFALKNTFAAKKLMFLYKDALHLSASQVATFAIIVGLPSYLRPVMGALSDLYLLFGYHRRSYYIAAWLATSFGYFWLAQQHAFHYWTVAALVILMGSGAWFAMVIYDAVMVRAGNRDGSIGRLQGIQQCVPYVLGMFLGPVKGYVTEHWSYAHCFLTSAGIALLAMPLALLIPERRVVGDRESHETQEEHAARRQAMRDEREQVGATLREAVQTPGLWAVVGYVFYLVLTPGYSTAQFYYSVNVLHFGKQFLGDLDSFGNAGAILGIISFAALAKRLPVRALVWGAFLGDCANYLVLMGLRGHHSGIVVNFAQNYVDIIYNLCMITIAARACPQKVEGSIYGLVLAVIFLANMLGEQVGASVYDHFGPASHHSIAHGWYALLWIAEGLTVAAVVFIPFLPAWTRSNEPLHPQKEGAR